MPRIADFVLRIITVRRLLVAAALLSSLGLAAALAGPHLRAWYHLSAARSELKKYHNLQAIHHLQICLRTWPADADVLFLVARTARRAGAYGEAEQALDKYQARRGCDEAVTLERILLRAENGELDQVGGFCRHWIEQGHPDKTFIFEACVRGYLQAYRLSDARLCLQRWQQEEPDNPQTITWRARFTIAGACPGRRWRPIGRSCKPIRSTTRHASS